MAFNSQSEQSEHLQLPAEVIDLVNQLKEEITGAANEVAMVRSSLLPARPPETAAAVPAIEDYRPRQANESEAIKAANFNAVPTADMLTKFKEAA